MYQVRLHDTATGESATLLPGRGFACAAARLAAPGGLREAVWAPEGFLEEAARPTSGGIPILCPYPGRLASTTIAFEGRSYQLEGVDPLARPIHGFAHDRCWRLLEATPRRAVAEFLLSRDAADRLGRWPADFRLEAVWELTEGRLACQLALTALGRMPAALGLHPYLPLPVAGGAGCRLELPVRQWQPQRDLLPSGPLEPASAGGLTDTLPLGGATLDDVFTGIVADADGQVTASLIEPGGTGWSVRFDPVFTAIVVFTPPSGRAVCIEPYTVLPGAAGFEADRGWRVLETGESLTASMTIQPLPGPAG